MQDPYQILGVSPTASDDEIKSAYRRLAKQYHPDINPGDAEAARKMNEINPAYEQIKTERKNGTTANHTTYTQQNQNKAYGDRSYQGYGSSYGQSSRQTYTGEEFNPFDIFGWNRSRRRKPVFLFIILGIFIVNSIFSTLVLKSMNTQAMDYETMYGSEIYGNDFESFFTAPPDTDSSDDTAINEDSAASPASPYQNYWWNNYYNSQNKSK